MLILLILHHEHVGYRLFSRSPYLIGYLAVHLELSGATPTCSTLNYWSIFSPCQLQGQINRHTSGHDHSVLCFQSPGRFSGYAPRGFFRFAVLTARRPFSLSTQHRFLRCLPHQQHMHLFLFSLLWWVVWFRYNLIRLPALDTLNESAVAFSGRKLLQWVRYLNPIRGPVRQIWRIPGVCPLQPTEREERKKVERESTCAAGPTFLTH
jgi:hypothetical protein